MVDQPMHIVDAPLPDAINFDVLKRRGIAKLKELAGASWTNFNEADPGVTILDQLCYALTELGYCAGFPIEDVLTGANGKIDYQRQFFEPQDILTTSPITIDDYRRLLHDRVAGLAAVYIVAQRQPGAPPGPCTGRYLTYLAMQDVKEAPDAMQVEDLRNNVQALLNDQRNLGELFLKPHMLTVRPIRLAGAVTLAPGADLNDVYVRIVQTLATYAVPPAVHAGYQELRSQGVEADLIFNGPRLDHGWISGAQALGAKRDRVSLHSLCQLLAAVAGVAQVDGLAFAGEPTPGAPGAPASAAAASVQAIDIDAGAIPQFDLAALTLQQNSGWPSQRDEPKARYLGALGRQHQSASVDSKVDRAPPLPQGRYRNIEEYYSIQNTFPDTYGIGHNSLQSNAPSYRVASARQLKGYLMVYDQLLANQFSQLAHVGELFSFHPPAPPRKLDYPAYGATYYCQPLYEVPDVMPLLHGNAAFAYQFDPERSAPLVERDGWRRYQQQPFNAYLHGLRGMMEDPSGAAQRRDAMLSHLMARHGDQAGLYDGMISAGHRYGEATRTRVVVKSIWLQNLPLLSYGRARAPGGQGAPGPAAAGAAAGGQPDRRWPAIDGALDEAAIYHAARLQPADLQRHSAFALKANILLGLSEHLLALHGRLGALIERPAFLHWLDQATAAPAPAPSDLYVAVRDDGVHELRENGQALVGIAGLAGKAPTLADYQDHLTQLDRLASNGQGMLVVEHLLLAEEPECTDPWYFLSASLVLPDYVALFQQDYFFAALQTVVAQHWPAHVRLRLKRCKLAVLKPLMAQAATVHGNAIGSPQRRAAALVVNKLLRGLPEGLYVN